MGLAVHVYRRDATYVWRRRLPVDVEPAGSIQISLRTRDPDHARQIAAVVTAESAGIFKDMMKKRLTPAEARGLFNRVVQQETARLAHPNRTLSDLHEAQRRPSMPGHLAPEVYALAILRALRGDQADPTEDAFFELVRDRDGAEAYYAAGQHLHEEAAAYAAPLVDEAARPFAEQVVAKALRRGDGIADDDLLAAFRVILTGRAAAFSPDRGLTIRSAAEIGPDDDLDPDTPKIPRAWFEEGSDVPEASGAPGTTIAVAHAGSIAAPDEAVGDEDDTPDPAFMAVAERVIEVQAHEDISPAQQQQTRQTAKLFVGLTDITDIRRLRQQHLSAFVDQLRKLPTSYGKSRNDRNRPIAEIIAAAAELPPEQRGLSVPTINRHLAIIQRITRKAGSEGIVIDSFLDFDALRRKDRRRARDKRDSLTMEEVKQLLRHPVFAGCKSEARRRTPGPHIFRDALYWLPVLAVYTGARREELAAMETRDVVQMDGIWCLRLHPNTNRKRLKNTTSVRTVPMHSDLIALGFLDYVATVPESGNLFPALKRKSKNAGLGADRAYLIDKIFEDQFGADRGAKSFHSTRHYVTDCLRNAGVEKHVRLDILGHSGEDIEDETYGSTSPVAVMKAAIETLPTVIATVTTR